MLTDKQKVAPEMYEALSLLYKLHCDGAFSLRDKDYIAITKAAAAICRAEGGKQKLRRRTE